MTSSEATSLDELREAAAGCRACELWKTGTQTVFGEGSANAELMLVGEQPGDREDIGEALRRPGRCSPGPRSGGGWRGPLDCLRDQRRQALPLGSTWEAA